MGLQPGMVVCELHSATAFGVPFMLAAQAMAEFTLLAVPGTVLSWLPAARGESKLVAATAVAPFDVPETCLIWLPAARGESNASAEWALKVIAVRAAAPMVIRRFRVFIFSFCFGTLHCDAM